MLEATGLGLSAGGRELIGALDLALAPGQFWSLLGRNGSGKTSLILALAGLRPPQRATIALVTVPLGTVLVFVAVMLAAGPAVLVRLKFAGVPTPATVAVTV